MQILEKYLRYIFRVEAFNPLDDTVLFNCFALDKIN